MSINYKRVKNITVKAFFVYFYYGILEKTEYIIIVCKTEGYVEAWSLATVWGIGYKFEVNG